MGQLAATRRLHSLTRHRTGFDFDFGRGPIARAWGSCTCAACTSGSLRLRVRVRECSGDLTPAISRRSGAGSRPPRKLPILRGDFHLFPLFDEEGNADFQAGLQPGSLGPAARGVAANRRFRVGNVQLNEYWQL